jgi:hypothetical protein
VLISVRLMVVTCFLAALFGCSGGGGSKGDANDPEKTTDVEAMKDETGNVGGATKKK